MTECDAASAVVDTGAAGSWKTDFGNTHGGEEPAWFFRSGGHGAFNTLTPPNATTSTVEPALFPAARTNRLPLPLEVTTLVRYLRS